MLQILGLPMVCINRTFLLRPRVGEISTFQLTDCTVRPYMFAVWQLMKCCSNAFTDKLTDVDL